MEYIVSCDDEECSNGIQLQNIKSGIFAAKRETQIICQYACWKHAFEVIGSDHQIYLYLFGWKAHVTDISDHTRVVFLGLCVCVSILPWSKPLSVQCGRRYVCTWEIKGTHRAQGMSMKPVLCTSLCLICYQMWATIMSLIYWFVPQTPNKKSQLLSPAHSCGTDGSFFSLVPPWNLEMPMFCL